MGTICLKEVNQALAAVLGLVEGPKRFLGSTHIGKHILFSKFCSILSPSYLSSPGGWVDYYDIITISASVRVRK